MSLSISVNPGYDWPAGSNITNDRLRRTAKPAVGITGSVGADEVLADSLPVDRLKSEPIYWATGDAGTDTMTLALDNAPAALADGLIIRFLAASDKTSAATINLDGLGSKALRRVDDTALQTGDIQDDQVVECVYVSSANSAAGAWLMLSASTLETWPYAEASRGGGDAYSATVVGISAAPKVGDRFVFSVKTGESNTGAATLAINGGSAYAIRFWHDGALVGGEFKAGGIVAVTFNGSHWCIDSPTNDPRYGVDSGGSGTAYVVNVPGISALETGLRIWFRATTTSLGAATINVSGLGVQSLTRWDGSAIQAGDLYAYSFYGITWNGSAWALDAQRKIYVSGQQSVTDGAGTASAAHNLVRVPTRMEWYLVCTTDDKGYSAGTMITASSCTDSDRNPCGTQWCNASNLGLRYRDAIYILDNSTGSWTKITHSSWRWVGFAEICY